MPTVKFKNADVSYTVCGKGPAIVWLHGYLESKNIWEELIIAFENDYTNVCIDLLGHGNSGVVNETHLPSLHANAVDEV